MICVLYWEFGDGFGECDDIFLVIDVFIMYRESYVIFKFFIFLVVDIGYYCMKSVVIL